MSSPDPDALARAVPLLGLALLCYLLGAASARFSLPPYPALVAPGFEALEARGERRELISDPLRTNLWSPARSDRVGVTVHDTARALQGLTFHTAGNTTGAYLLDMDGAVVHEWHVPFRTAWPRATHVANPVPEDFIYWRDAHLYPNGDVLALYIGSGPTPWGYGLVKVDRESNVVWRFEGQTHHALSVAADGSIYTLTHDFRDQARQAVAGAPHFPRLVLEDSVVRLSAEGEVLARVSVFDAIAGSPYRAMLQAAGDWDPLHTNDVEPLTPEFLAHHPALDGQDVMISIRNLSVLATLDMDEGVVGWASRGAWRRQHDPDVMDDGTVLLFDNFGHMGGGGPSRVVRIRPGHPEPGEGWAYAGSTQRPFFSRLRSVQQALPNGNVLVTESDPGRIFEVTPEGDIVWEYHHPVRRRDAEGRSFVAVVSAGARFTPDELDFEFLGPRSR